MQTVNMENVLIQFDSAFHVGLKTHYCLLLSQLYMHKITRQASDKMGIQTNIFEPAHDKTYNKTCVTSKEPNQPVCPPSMARILVYPSLDSLEDVEGT